MSTQEQLDRYLNFLEADPGNIHLIKSASDFAYQLGHFEQAMALSAKGITLSPEDREIRSTQALASLSLGKIEEAQSILQGLIDEGEHNPAIRYNLAYCLALKNQFQAALDLLLDAEAEYPIIPQMAHLKVQALHHLGLVEEAIALGNQLSKAHPEDGVLHGLLSTLYIDHMDFDLAKQHAELAIKAGEINTHAYTSLGTLALSEQDDVNAEQYFEQAIQLKKNDGRAWLGKAMVQMLQKQFAEAELSFQSALHYMPKHLGTWQALAWCQIAQNHLDAAETTVKISMDIDQNFAENHGTLAILQIIKGQFDLAQASIVRALRLDRQSFSGLYAQALLLKQQGKIEASEKLVEGILDYPLMPDQSSLRQFLVKYMGKP